MTNDNIILKFKSEITRFLHGRKLGRSPELFSGDREMYEVNKQLLNEDEILNEIISIIDDFQPNRGENIEHFIVRLKEKIIQFSKEKIFFGKSHIDKVLYFLDHYVEFSKIKIPTNNLLSVFEYPTGSYFFPDIGDKWIDNPNRIHIIGMTFDRLGKIDIISADNHLTSVTLEFRITTNIKPLKFIVDKILYRKAFSHMALLLSSVSPPYKDAKKWLKEKLPKILVQSHFWLNDQYHDFEIELRKRTDLYLPAFRGKRLPVDIFDSYYPHHDEKRLIREEFAVLSILIKDIS